MLGSGTSSVHSVVHEQSIDRQVSKAQDGRHRRADCGHSVRESLPPTKELRVEPVGQDSADVDTCYRVGDRAIP